MLMRIIGVLRNIAEKFGVGIIKNKTMSMCGVW